MSRKSVRFNSALAAEAVRDALLRSISTHGMPPYLEPWFYRMHRKDDETRPVWGVVETQRFRLRRSGGGVYAPTFYASGSLSLAVLELTGTSTSGQSSGYHFASL